MTVHEAFAAVMADVQAIAKRDRNSAQNFSFRGIDAVMNAVGPALREHGVIIAPIAAVSSHRDVTVGQKGTPMRECTVTVTYRVYGPDGDYFDGQVVAEAMDAGDKGTAKAMSVGYRTFLLQALTIPTDEPDPDQSSYERARPVPPWTVNQAKQRLLEALTVHGLPADAGREMAKQAWVDLKGDDRWQAWELGFPQAEVEAWVNQPGEEGT